VKDLARNIIGLIFPPKCIVCDQFSISENGICNICFNKIDFISNNSCFVCGYPFEISTEPSQICGPCMQTPPSFQQAKSVLFYDDNSSPLIKKFKYYDKPELASYFAKIMYNYDQNFFNDIDIITSIPLYWTRQLKRLYNQSSLLGIHLAKLTNKNFIPSLVKRVKNTRPQFSLDLQQRKKNLKNAFQANLKYAPKVKNKNILLVDDVFTTGETINRTSKELKKLQVNNIKVLTLARSKN
jgi:ComF family protein